jgi:cob(I)alamin adenosyltransferase
MAEQSNRPDDQAIGIDTAAQPRRPPKSRANQPKGLVIVNTGNGKGKTTAALGILTRAWGRDMRLGGIQFFKHENAHFGELRAMERMGIELTPMGDGFTWTSRDLDETQAKALHGWQTAKQKITSGDYDIFLLDEFTYVMHFGWLDADEVVAWLRTNKPPMLHLIITGRDAPAALIAFADLVTEMREIKHPYNDQGIRAQKGIEF